MMGSKRSIVAALAALLLLGTAPLALAKDLRGIALVIGESDYDSDALRDLANPKNDARAMDVLLDSLGFEVDRVLDEDEGRLRQSIDDFIADAADADVALIYYSGHGIEAGGENYLVPTDADISTPEGAGASLVALDDVLDRLARTVPVTIVLLDACRSNAFPPGTGVELPGSAQVVDVAATGLGEVRGPTPVAVAGKPDDSLGMIIGFAAAPGQAALDGEAGGNSPYAAALLTHLGAPNTSLADVMAMVTEEVYLKTGGRQQPWTNSSLRGALSFNAAPVSLDPGTEAILEGRRKLLLSIATLSDSDRRQVASLAQESDVPMDALYGSLGALRARAPDDPNALSQVLRQQAELLKTMLDQSTALATSDAEIQRFSDLAREALDQGAIETSLAFLEQAKARYASIEGTRALTKAQRRTWQIQGGELLSRTAETYALAADYVNAAQNYGGAYEQVATLDKQLSYVYKLNQADALTDYTNLSGDPAGVESAFVLYQQAIELAPGGKQSVSWAGAQNSYAIALRLAGSMRGDRELMARARQAFNAVLKAVPYKTYPDLWLMTKTNLAALATEMSDYETGTGSLEQAIADYRDILKVQPRDADPIGWAMTSANLGNSLSILGDRTGDTALLGEAVSAFEAALEIFDRNSSPLDWAKTQGNLGTVYTSLGKAGDAAMFQRAIDAFNAALEIETRERAPILWASDKGNLGIALDALGEATKDDGKLLEAIAAFREALEIVTARDQPTLYVHLYGSLANALNIYGLGQQGTAELEQAAAAARGALAVLADGPVQQRATLLNVLGRSVAVIGMRTRDRTMIVDGRKTLVEAQQAWASIGLDYGAYFERRFAEIDKALAELN